MKILVCGDRNWTVAAPIEATLRQLGKGPHELVHGAARGADTIAAIAAKRLADMGAGGWRVLCERHGAAKCPASCHGGWPARWEIYGLAAGPIRNQQMLDDNKGEIERVYAFHDQFEQSRGTADMVRRAAAAGIWVARVSSNGMTMIMV